MRSNLQPSYSKHASARMFDRGIFKKQVRRTLNRPAAAYCSDSLQTAEYETSSGVILRAIYLMTAETQKPHIVSVIRLGKLNNAAQRTAVGIHYCQRFDLAYVALSSGEMKTTEQVAAGLYCDLNREGGVIGVEVFNYSQVDCVKNDNPLSILEHLPNF